jgi:hypothetical protein
MVLKKSSKFYKNNQIAGIIKVATALPSPILIPGHNGSTKLNNFNFENQQDYYMSNIQFDLKQGSTSTWKNENLVTDDAAQGPKMPVVQNLEIEDDKDAVAEDQKMPALENPETEFETEDELAPKKKYCGYLDIEMQLYKKDVQYNTATLFCELIVCMWKRLRDYPSYREYLLKKLGQIVMEMNYKNMLPDAYALKLKDFILACN